MNLEYKNKHVLSVGEIIVIILMIIGLYVTYILDQTTINEHFLKIGIQVESRLLLIIKLVISSLFLILAYFLLKKSKLKSKTRKRKFKDKIAILNSMKNNPKWRTYSNHKKLNMSEIELIKHTIWFVKKQFIEEKVILDRGAKVQTFVLLKKGLNFLDKHKELLTQ